MPSTQDQRPAGGGETPGAVPPALPLGQSYEDALDEIDRILHQMLLLAELSANGGGSLDRETLQRVLERLQSKLDRIADRLGES